LTITLVAPGVHGAVVAGTHGAGVKTPSLAAVAAATTGLDIVPQAPNVGMFTIGANAWMLAAGDPALTGVPMGTAVSGAGTGGIAIEQLIIAPVLTSGGTAIDCRPAAIVIQTSGPHRAAALHTGPVAARVNSGAVLPGILLDDVRFQDLVGEARTRIVRHSPDWTEHNVSDPGITLIELFAWLTEILTYRINRIPERMHLGLLGLVGVKPVPPRQAVVDVRFVLGHSAGGVIPEHTEVCSPRASGGEPIVFQTAEELVIPARGLAAYAVQGSDGIAAVAADGGIARPSEGHQPSFTASDPGAGALMLGFEGPIARLVLRVSFDSTPASGPADARVQPRLAWEACGADGAWRPATVIDDETGGFQRGGGAVTLEIPSQAGPTELGGLHLHWVRCRRGDDGPTAIGPAPRIEAVSAAVAGGVVGARHAATVYEELVGDSEGIPGTSYRLRNRPVLELEAGETLEVRERDSNRWVAWTRVDTFAMSGPADHHFLLDATSGEIRFGPAIRQPDGGWRRFGAVPGPGAALRMTRYRYGGGSAGNVAPRTLRVLAKPLAGVVGVTNPRPATGGIDGESLGSARERTRLELRERTRAVTADDFERIARAASSDVARAVCVAPDGDRPVRVHLLPRVALPDRHLDLAELTPSDELMQTVAAALDRRRLIGTRIRLVPVRLRAVSVVVDVRASPLADLERVQHDVEHALYVYLNPLIGGSPHGPGEGWPCGRGLNQGELFGIAYSIPGVELVHILRMYETDIATGAQAAQPSDGRIGLERDEVIASGRHIVKAVHRGRA